MGAIAHGSGASGMSRMREKSPFPASKQTIYPMKIRFASQFRLDLRSPQRFSVTCSAIPSYSEDEKTVKRMQNIGDE
jgi:hypothetical protein